MKIEAPQGETLERLFALENELHREGVSFDTGYFFSGQTRDWELDESLSGPLASEQIIERLRTAGFKFTVERL